MIGFFKRLFFWIVLCGLLIALGIYLAKKITTKSETKPVVLGQVIRKDLVQRITFAGVIASRRRTIITAPYSGYIKILYVKIGDRVKKGDPLVSITASLDSFEPVHPLRAPFSGVVTLVRKSEGEFAKENDAQDYVLRIDDISRFFVEAKVPEIDRLKVAIGQEAVIKASAISDIPFHGIVRRLSLAPEEKAQGFSFSGKTQVEYQVYIEITDSDTRIKPGMSAIIDVIAASAKQVLTIGHEFVHEDEGQSYVLLKDGTKREIKIGLRNDEIVEIVDGLNEGEEVRQVEFAP